MILKLLKQIIVFLILLVLSAKFIFNFSNHNLFLYFYGILVTLILFIVFIISFAFYKDPYELSKKSKRLIKKKYFVSCLVAVRNEENIITRCIESFLAQTYENKEIIFINDCSTDGTLRILQSYADKKLIRLINLKTNLGKKKALAQGMLVAKGEIFAMSDSDSILFPDAIERIVSVFNLDPTIGGVSGHSRALNANTNILTKAQDAWYEGQYSIRKAFESVFGCVSCVSGPLACFRKEAIYNMIPAWQFDSFLGQEFRFATDRTLTGLVLGSIVHGQKLKDKYRDSEFIKSHDYPIKEWKIVYCKSAKALTQIPDTFKKVIKQQIRWKKSFIRNTFFTGAFYWRKPFLPAFVYYTHIIFVIAGPFITFRHLIYLPLHQDYLSGILYLSGIVFVGCMFGLACRIEDPSNSRWIYRPIMSLLSTLVLSWLIFYSALTIKKMVWSRG